MRQNEVPSVGVEMTFASNNSGWRFQPEIAVFALASLFWRGCRMSLL